MKYLILRLEEDIAMADPADVALIMAYWPNGKGLAVKTSEIQDSVMVTGWYPVRAGGATEQAIEANLTPYLAETTQLSFDTGKEVQ